VLTRLDETIPTVIERPSKRDEDMSTHQRLTNRTADSPTGNQPGDNKSKKRNFEFSVTQIVGGALAAMTAAALGSQLSAAGTIVGAALASVIAAVAGSLYTASLRRTRDKVKTVFWTGEPNEVKEPTVMEIIPDSKGHIAGQRSHLVAPEPDPNQKPQGPKLNWKRVLVVALVTFGIAAVALTTFEVVTGQALSGGKGTTFQQVSEGTSDKGSETKKKEPTKKKPTPTAPAESASEQPTAEPRAQASNSQPEATTDTTTEAPTPEASSAPSSTPSSGG
jgi:hypothetical protein